MDHSRKFPAFSTSKNINMGCAGVAEMDIGTIRVISDGVISVVSRYDIWGLESKSFKSVVRPLLSHGHS